jgi:hypothetical protein
VQRRTWVLAGISALIGAGAGAGLLLWHLSGPVQQGRLARMQLEAAYDISVLEKLRAGRLDEARDLLEGRVDVAVAGLDAFAREDKTLSREAVSTLQAIAKYREGVSYIPSDVAKRAGVPEILDAARKGHLTPQSRSDAR